MTKISVYQDVSVIEIAAGGIQGPKGDKGDGAATVTVGTTTTGNAGTNASVTNSGTANDVVLNFTIPQGLKGDKGDTGNPGTNGTNGTDGDSAYQVAVNNGFVGTEQQWLESLVGETGAQGAPGLPGTNGTDGVDGADGAPGVGVIPGGTAGQVLTKIDSTDYNTQWSTIDLSTKQDVVSGVSSTEIGYLDGVTSSIQTQLNAKQATINPGTGLIFNTYSGIPYLEIDQTSNINVTGLDVSGSADFTGATVTGLPTTSAATPIAGGTVLGETSSTTNTVALGYNVSPTANEVTLGNSSITKFKVPGIGLVASTTSTLFGAPIKEKVNSLGTVSSGPIAFNILTASVINMVVGTGANFTINFRGSSTVTLNSMLDIDESITVVFIANSAGSYYPNTLQIDGGAGTIVNNRWQGGTAPTAGTGGSADIYTFNIQKVANNLYQMFSSQTKFA